MTVTEIKTLLIEKYLQKMTEYLSNDGEDVLRIGSGTICFPCVDEAGNDSYIRLVVSVPTGARDGEGFDGYALAQDYAFSVEEKRQKKEKKEAEKVKKIARDKSKRKKEEEKE